MALSYASNIQRNLSIFVFFFSKVQFVLIYDCAVHDGSY